MRLLGTGFGQLGAGSTTGSSNPVSVRSDANTSDPLQDVTAIAAGNSHTCAVLADGTVRCWGNNFGFALGVGIGTDFSATPGRLALGEGGDE